MSESLKRALEAARERPTAANQRVRCPYDRHCLFHRHFYCFFLRVANLVHTTESRQKRLLRRSLLLGPFATLPGKPQKRMSLRRLTKMSHAREAEKRCLERTQPIAFPFSTSHSRPSVPILWPRWKCLQGHLELGCDSIEVWYRPFQVAWLKWGFQESRQSALVL